jgi:hypothetical protein
VQRYNSVIWGENVIIRDCRGIRRMGAMCKVGTVGYSVSGECEGSRDSRGKVGEIEAEREERRKKMLGGEKKGKGKTKLSQLIFVQNGRGR